jgi:hypothetical protein
MNVKTILHDEWMGRMWRKWSQPILRYCRRIDMGNEGKHNEPQSPRTEPTTFHIRGPFAKFMDSPYYFELELCGGAVTVFFSKYLPWQAMHFLQRSTHFSETCCRPSITSKFLASELHFHGWKSSEIAWGEIWIEFCFRLGKSGSVEPH